MSASTNAHFDFRNILQLSLHGPPPPPNDSPRPPRRKRYSGKNPRRFEDKYKEHRGDAETLAKVAASGKTPAGTHVPILLPEILEVLRIRPGETVADCTLGYGGHAAALLEAVQPEPGPPVISARIGIWLIPGLSES